MARSEARQSFYSFRCHMRPEMVRGWWLKEISEHLERFYYRFMNGERPKLVLMAPPQHGKTTIVTDLIAWVAGKNPNLKCLFTSYSDDLGQGVNVALQRMMDSDRFKQVFGSRLPAFGRAVEGMRNSNLLEYVGDNPHNPGVPSAYKGSFRNTTVNGQVTGKGLDFGFIDDPIKGRREANSLTVRDATWAWLTDDFFTRFSDHAALLMTLTRWHLDDPAGRFLQKFPETVVLDYPAIATREEKHRKKGDPLFPEFKSLEFLEERRRGLSQASWVSLYQQSPIIAGGGMFPIEKFSVVNALPSKGVMKTVRYWDKAATEMGGAYTAGVKMVKLDNGTFIVTDVRRAQMGALQREQMILQTAQLDRQESGPNVLTVIEQEPGSGGKDSAEASIRMLAGYKVEADKVTDAKHVRADPYAAQVQAGNVAILAGQWNKEFLNEHETFPNGVYLDTVDAAAGAFAKLTLGSSYRSNMDWVGDVPPNILNQQGAVRIW